MASEDQVVRGRWLELVLRGAAAALLVFRGTATALWARARSTLEPCSGEFRSRSAESRVGRAELSLHPECEIGQSQGFVARHAAGIDHPFDEARLDELDAALGAERLDGLLALLKSECGERPPRFRRHLARGDLAGIRAEAHNLKGAASSVGARALAEAAMAIEQLTDLVAANPLLDQLDRIAVMTALASDGRRAASPARVAIA